MKYSKYPFYISQLIIKSLKGQLTEAEQEELDRWLTIEANRVLYLSLSRRNLDDKKNLYGQLHPERTWERLEKRLYLRKRSYFRNIIRYAAAVLLLAMISTAVYLYWNSLLLFLSPWFGRRNRFRVQPGHFWFLHPEKR